MTEVGDETAFYEARAAYVKKAERAALVQGRAKYRGGKARCSECGKPGTMRYTVTDGELISECTAAPGCDASYTVRRRRYRNVRQLREAARAAREVTEEALIRAKLDAVYGLAKSDESASDLPGRLVQETRAFDQLSERLRDVVANPVRRSRAVDDGKQLDRDILVVRAAPAGAEKARITASDVMPLAKSVRLARFPHSTVTQHHDGADVQTVVEQSPYTYTELYIPVGGGEKI